MIRLFAELLRHYRSISRLIPPKWGEGEFEA